MALIDWYHAVLYENGVQTAWIRNAQQIDSDAETTPPLGRDFIYANLSATQTARVVFYKKTNGARQSYDIPPNTGESPVQIPQAFLNFDGGYSLGWV